MTQDLKFVSAEEFAQTSELEVQLTRMFECVKFARENLETDEYRQFLEEMLEMLKKE